MTIAELETAIREGVHPVVLVFDNEQYGTIHDHQVRRGLAPVGTDLGPVDWAKVAEGFGAIGVHVDRDDEFEAALRAALAATLPTVLHLVLDRRWASVDRVGDAVSADLRTPVEPESAPERELELDMAPEPAEAEPDPATIQVAEAEEADLVAAAEPDPELEPVGVPETGAVAAPEPEPLGVPETGAVAEPEPEPAALPETGAVAEPEPEPAALPETGVVLEPDPDGEASLEPVPAADPGTPAAS
jgi:hypothetical protein